MALRERRRPIRNRKGFDPYNQKDFKVMKLKPKRNSQSKKEKSVSVRVISRVHIPKERVNQKERANME